jgi:hypothetical protein
MRSEALLVSLSYGVGGLAVQYVLEANAPDVPKPLDGFVSYSIEFSSFPDFAGKYNSLERVLCELEELRDGLAGNKSHPNTFSNNLLENIGHLIGTKPYIRVGGNTQDYALYDASLAVAINGTFNASRSPDYPTTINIGPAYFESYSTWNATKFSHGFNMGLGGRDSSGWQTLLDTVSLACSALGDKLYWWEYGNEPDLFSTSAQGPVRPTNWNESTFVSQWLNGTRKIGELVKQHCPDLASNSSYGFLAPSFAGTNNHLKAPLTWKDGFNADKNIKLFSSHK